MPYLSGKVSKMIKFFGLSVTHDKLSDIVLVICYHINESQILLTAFFRNMFGGSNVISRRSWIMDERSKPV